MNEVSTCGKLDEKIQKAHQISYVRNRLYGSLALCHQGFRVFIFSSEAFSKAFDREFWANGSSKQKLLTNADMDGHLGDLCQFLLFLAAEEAQSVGQRTLDRHAFSWACSTWLCAVVQAGWTRRGLRDRKVRLLNYFSSYWSFGIYYFQSRSFRFE